MDISMNSMALSLTVPARLQFACEHAALVSLPRIRGERARQQAERVAREKTATQARPCDFCAPRGGVLVTRQPLPSPALSGAMGLHQERVAVVAAAEHDPARSNGEQQYEAYPREESLMDNTSPEPLPTTDAATLAATDGRPMGVFPPPRKLTAEQERELTRQYAETGTPIADIARTFSLSEVSVGRIAQRNGAASRRRRAATRDTTADAPTAPVSARRGRRRRTDAEPEAGAEMGGATRGRRPRAAEGTGTPPSRPRRAVSAAGAAAAAPALSAPEPAAQAAGGGARRRFRIRFFAETVVEAEDVRDALGQAEALGATDVSGIVQDNG